MALEGGLSRLLEESGAFSRLEPEERRRIKEEVERLELIDRLNTQQNAHVFVLLRKGPDKSIVYDDINETATRYLSAATGQQLTREELIGKNSAMLGLTEFSQQLNPAYEEAMRTGKPQTKIATLQTEDGLRYFQNQITPVRFADGTPRAAVHAHDITGEVQAGEGHNLFRTLVEHSRDLIALIDLRDNSLIYQSPSIDETLGHPKGRIRHDVLEWAAPEDRQRVQQAIQEVMESPNEPRQSIEIRALHADGTYRTLDARSSVVHEGSEPRWLIVNARDVTQQRALEEQFRQSQKMEAIGRLAGGVAHDFNNLLTVIGGEAEFLSYEHPGHESVEEILKSTERAAGLTRQLLAFSRKQVLRPHSIDVNGIVGGLQKMLGRLIGEDITIKTDLQYKPYQVLADPGQLEQVIMNLATNARDAMPRGGTLEIATRNVKLHGQDAKELPEGEYLELRISDSGHGIDAEDIPHIFEPFYTTKEAGKGTGLGLSTVYGIIAQSSGDIRVQSAQGGGTTFRIYLPRSKAAKEVAATTEEAQRKGGGLILLIEDEAPVLDLAQRVLTRAGYQVISATDGDEGRDIVDALGHHLSAIISDIVMPHGSGTDLARYARKHNPDLPIVLMTGYSSSFLPEVQDGMHLETVLEKPWTIKSLEEAVYNAVNKPRTQSRSA